MSTLTWQKSTYSSSDGNTNCVEVATSATTGIAHVREGDDPATVLTLRTSALHALLTHLKNDGPNLPDGGAQ